ncbi:MAG: metallophosphoesterase [Bacillus sp. (in: firmicutes)]
MKWLRLIFYLVVYVLVSLWIGTTWVGWLHALSVNIPSAIVMTVVLVAAVSMIVGRLHTKLYFLTALGNVWLFFLQYGLTLGLLSLLLQLFLPMKWVGIICLALLVGLLVCGVYLAYSPVIRKQTIQIDKRGEPTRLVIGSDFHLGFFSNKRHLQRFVDLANAEEPNIVLLAGDIVDDNPAWFVHYGMEDVMKQLKPTDGVYGVLGNHEYYGRQILKFVDIMADSNVHILRDESVEVRGLVITGQEDQTNAQRKALVDLKPSDEEKPWIVMNHTPSDLALPALLGVDLHVSGHTHHGQMWPNHVVTKRMFEIDYGYILKKRMHAIVSSGFGFWGPPMRIGSRCELWVVDLEFTKQ